MKLLITGGCGFVGSHVSKALADKGHKVIALDSNTLNGQFGEAVKVIVGDCCNINDMISTMDKFTPEVVVHLAADSLVHRCNNHPHTAFSINVNGLMNILLAVRKAKVRRFVFISSSSVYGDFQYTPTDEEHPKNPRGIYGGTKYAGEVLTKTFCEQYGIEWVIARLSAVYGPEGTEGRVVQLLLEKAIADKKLKVEGAYRKLDFTYIDDAVEGICLTSLEENASDEVFNITRGEGRSLRELTTIIAAVVGPVVVDYGEANHSRSERGALDISKAMGLLGYNPKWSLEDGIKEYYKWMVEK